MNTITKISFRKRPIVLPPNYRPIHALAQIVLILVICCRANRANLLKLHLFSWALKVTENSDTLTSWVNNDFKTELSVWGIDPVLNRGLQYAVADKIVEIDSGIYQITAKGLEFYDLIKKDKDLFDEEKQFLSTIGKKITDKKINEQSKKWTLFYAKN